MFVSKLSIVVFMVAKSYAADSLVKTPAPRTIEFTMDEAGNLLRSISAQAHPGKPENAYFGDFVILSLDWINRASTDYKTLQVKLVDKCEKCSAGDLLGARYEDGKFIIDVYAPKLVQLAWSEKLGRTVINRRLVVLLYVLGFTHERLHCLKPELLDLNHPQPIKVRVQEELRVWAEVAIYGVRTIRQRIGDADIPADFLESDNILRRCHDNPACPEFQRFVRSKCGFLETVAKK